MSWNLKIIMLFHANSTKYGMKSQNQDIIPYKFYQKHHEISKSWRYSLKILRRTPWNLTIMTLFHTNSTKNVKKSQNQDFIPYKFYQKCHEVTQLWRYSIQIQPKNVMKSQNHNIIPFKFFQKCHGFSKSWHYSIKNLPKMEEQWCIQNLAKLNTRINGEKNAYNVQIITNLHTHRKKCLISHFIILESSRCSTHVNRWRNWLCQWNGRRRRRGRRQFLEGCARRTRTMFGWPWMRIQGVGWRCSWSDTSRSGDSWRLKTMEERWISEEPRVNSWCGVESLLWNCWLSCRSWSVPLVDFAHQFLHFVNWALQH